MPTPAVLSGIMDPPPIMPVVEMNYVEGEYKLNGEDTTFDALMYNASGSQDDIGLVTGQGITGLHWDTSRWEQGIWPPSIRGTASLNAILASAMVESGGLTAVCEFEVTAPEIYGASDNVYLFALWRDSTFGAWNTPTEGTVYWQHYMESGIQVEGYFDSQVANDAGTSFNGYAGGSAWEASNDRRYRVAGTWCYDLGPEAGVNRYQGGQSIDGQPQGVDVSYGETPSNTSINLTYMDQVASSHFFGVGVDTAEIAATGVDDGWWWWPRGGFIIRYLAFYRARPVWTLPILSKGPHTPIRFGQLYTEVIHSPIKPSEIRMIPLKIDVEPLSPKMANVVPPPAYIDVVIIEPVIYASGSRIE